METPPASRGRPRTFDCQVALGAALRVFWQRGYDGASLDELTEAMGISRPSLYAAFGDKATLFRKAVEHYVAQSAGLREPVAGETAWDFVARLLEAAAKAAGDPDRPGGCFLVQGVLACGAAADPLKAEVARLRADGEELLAKRFKAAVKSGELPAGTNAKDLARFYTVVLHGMSVQITQGVTTAELRRVAERALEAWPREKSSED